MKETVEKNYIPFVVVILLAIRIISVSVFDTTEVTPLVHEDVSIVTSSTTQSDPFDSLDVSAQATFVFDIRTGKTLFEKNADLQLPLASLTKLMTTMLALETLPDEQTVYITLDALAEEGEYGLLPFERWRLKDLVDVTLVASSNDGAHALASAIAAFQNNPTSTDSAIALMNDRAHELGLSKTTFLNETGLDINNETEPGALGSARDVARVLVYILRNTPELFEPTRNGAITRYSLDLIPHTFDNTNAIANEIPWLIGSKTGYTDHAGGNLAVVFDAGLAHPIAAVVLGSSREGRFEDIQNIAEKTLMYLETHQ